MATGTGPVVLIVDDSEDVRSLLASLLIRLGYRVLEALDHLAAINMTADHPVDLVVLDLSMPRLNGAAFSRTYRERGGVAPVILITGTQGDDLEANMRCMRSRWPNPEALRHRPSTRNDRAASPPPGMKKRAQATSRPAHGGDGSPLCARRQRGPEWADLTPAEAVDRSLHSGVSLLTPRTLTRDNRRMRKCI